MSEFKKVIVLKNEIEASLMEATLLEHEIPHLIKTYHDSAYDGLFQMMKGWGHVEAPAEYHQEIQRIYEDLSQTE